MLLDSLVACLKWHCLPYSRKGFLWITVIRGRLQVLLAGHWEGRGSPWLSLLYLSRNSTLWKQCHDLSLPDRNAVVSHGEKAKFPMMYKEGTNIPGLTRTTLWRWQPARVESVLVLVARVYRVGCLQKWEMVGAALCQTETVPAWSHIATEPIAPLGNFNKG